MRQKTTEKLAVRTLFRQMSHHRRYFILLTISSFSPFEFPKRSMFVSLIIPAIMLFSVSALYIIEKKVVMGKRFAKAGFYWLVGFMIFLLIVNILNVMSPTIWQDPTYEKIVSSNVSSNAQ
jgi:hypothetical protein